MKDKLDEFPVRFVLHMDFRVKNNRQANLIQPKE
jgi:hypothetical protein